MVRHLFHGRVASHCAGTLCPLTESHVTGSTRKAGTTAELASSRKE